MHPLLGSAFAAAETLSCINHSGIIAQLPGRCADRYRIRWQLFLKGEICRRPWRQAAKEIHRPRQVVGGDTGQEEKGWPFYLGSNGLFVQVEPRISFVTPIKQRGVSERGK